MVTLVERIRTQGIWNTGHKKCFRIDPMKFKAMGMGGGVVKYIFIIIIKVFFSIRRFFYFAKLRCLYKSKPI